MKSSALSPRLSSLALATILALALSLVAVDAVFAARPTLVGTVVKEGGRPLDNGRVELSKPGEGEADLRAYTDARGRFAFRADPGVYELRVRYGDRVLLQIVGDGTARARPVAVRDQPQSVRVQVKTR